MTIVEIIECDCDDPSCKKKGTEGEVPDHIEECSCGHCHRELGKISCHIQK